MNPIATQRLAAVAATFLATVVVAQPPRRSLRCEPPSLDAFVAKAERDLEDAHDATLARAQPARLAGATLGWLRLQRADRAIQTLDAMVARCEAGMPDCEDDPDAWALVAHHWAARALGDYVAVRAAAPLQRAAERLVDESLRDTRAQTMRATALRTHAIGCASDLAQRLEDATTAQELDGAARRALGTFEAAFWREPIGAFSASPSAHDAAALFPCAIGLLASAEGRAERSLRSSLAADPAPCTGASERLVAKAQLASAIADELADRIGADATSDEDAGLRLDATMFALTGLRIATGPGLDSQWMRLRLRLPRGVARMRVEGLALDGWKCSFDFESALDDPTSHRGVYRVESHGPHQASWRQLVVHHGDHAFVVAAIEGAAVALPPRELPVTSPVDRAR